MIPAIIGDLVGSIYEFNNIKTKDFNFLPNEVFFTDDTLMTVAIGKALLETAENRKELSQRVIKNMQDLGNQYTSVSYGKMFHQWLKSKNPKPYNSYGNGAAMRVSPCGIVASTLEEAKELSRIVTEVTHNHPEGVKGAEAVAVAVFMARQGKSKTFIFNHIKRNYYDLKFNLDEIRETYTFDETCQGTVPYALAAFFESSYYIDAVRLAISIGGDSDTIASITSAIAGEYYGIPRKIKHRAIQFLDNELREIVLEFHKNYYTAITRKTKHNTPRIFGKIPKRYDPVIIYEKEIENMKKLMPYLTKREEDSNQDYYAPFNDEDLEIDRILGSFITLFRVNNIILEHRRNIKNNLNVNEIIEQVIDKKFTNLSFKELLMHHYYIYKHQQWGSMNDLQAFISSGFIKKLFECHIGFYDKQKIEELFKDRLNSWFIIHDKGIGVKK